MGLPGSLAARLAGPAASGLVTNPSLPLFLLLAYVSDRLTSGGEFINFGNLVASCGAVCEIGGVVGQTTDIEAIDLLPEIFAPVHVSPSSEGYWRGASREAVVNVKSYSSVFGIDPPGLLPLHVDSLHLAANSDYPKNVDAIKHQHDLQVPFWDNLETHESFALTAFANGVALVRKYPSKFEGKHGVYTYEEPDPITNTYKNPQSETNLKVGSTYSREEQLNLCRVWADLYRPEAKPLFEEAS